MMQYHKKIDVMMKMPVHLNKSSLTNETKLLLKNKLMGLLEDEDANYFTFLSRNIFPLILVLRVVSMVESFSLKIGIRR